VALAELGYAERTVSTAVNGQFVACGARAGTALAEGDRVEVLAPMQGG
jgi:sulfur carrier protein